MGRVGLVKIFEWVTRRGTRVGDVVAGTGGSVMTTVEHVQPAGDNGRPLPGDYVAIIPGPGTGRGLAIGYVDPISPDEIAPGEKRVYSRNPSTGSAIASVYLQNDGTVEVTNSAGATVTLETSGEINLNGVRITPAGNIIAPGSVEADSVLAAGLELAGHIHQVTSAPGVTGPNQ